jgi:uncharacterized protein YndB with AHSA1/START domain
MSTDRIEKKVLLRAPRSRVWKALSDSKEFGIWFGMKFDRPFEAGKPIRGVAAPTQVDPEVAKQQKPYEGQPFEISIDRIEPETLFSFRWHPFAIDPKVDYSKEPTTLIVFTLAEAPGGVLLTVTESGFDQIPLERRLVAFAADESCWLEGTRLIELYLARVA